MPIVTGGSVPRDGNGRTVGYWGVQTTNSKTLVGSGTTVHVPLFTISGSILIQGLWGVVITALGNNTAAYWRLNDGSNTPAITLSTGTSLTNAPVGSVIVKKALAATALTLVSSAASAVSEPAAAEGNYFSPIEATSINGGTTNLEFTYTTSDTPTTGAIQFFMDWYPLSPNATVTSL